MTPERLSAYVRVLVRESVIPLGGLLLTFYLVKTGQFAYWQTPFLAGMMLVSLVGRSDPPDPPEEPRPDSRAEIE